MLPQLSTMMIDNTCVQLACARVSGAVVNASEVTVLVAAVVILLSMLGLNLSGLLIPAGVALALAAKDLSHNFLAGFFLFAVQVPYLVVVRSDSYSKRMMRWRPTV
jgi:Mechanosensitive ion channel